MVSHALADRVGLQAPQDTASRRTIAEVRRPEQQGLALWQALRGVTRREVDPCRPRYFPLGVPAGAPAKPTESEDRVATGESSALPSIRSSSPSKQNWPFHKCSPEVLASDQWK